MISFLKVSIKSSLERFIKDNEGIIKAEEGAVKLYKKLSKKNPHDQDYKDQFKRSVQSLKGWKEHQAKLKMKHIQICVKEKAGELTVIKGSLYSSSATKQIDDGLSDEFRTFLVKGKPGQKDSHPANP